MIAALVIAAFFALWPVLGHAPWEDTRIVTHTVTVVATPDQCTVLRTQLAQAVTAGALTIIRREGFNKGCWK